MKAASATELGLLIFCVFGYDDQTRLQATYPFIWFLGFLFSSTDLDLENHSIVWKCGGFDGLVRKFSSFFGLVVLGELENGIAIWFIQIVFCCFQFPLGLCVFVSLCVCFYLSLKKRLALKNWDLGFGDCESEWGDLVFLTKLMQRSLWRTLPAWTASRSGGNRRGFLWLVEKITRWTCGQSANRMPYWLVLWSQAHSAL